MTLLFSISQVTFISFIFFELRTKSHERITKHNWKLLGVSLQSSIIITLKQRRLMFESAEAVRKRSTVFSLSQCSSLETFSEFLFFFSLFCHLTIFFWKYGFRKSKKDSNFARRRQSISRSRFSSLKVNPEILIAYWMSHCDIVSQPKISCSYPI